MNFKCYVLIHYETYGNPNIRFSWALVYRFREGYIYNLRNDFVFRVGYDEVNKYQY